MGKLHSCFVVGILALSAACGDDGGAAKMADAAVDAPPDAKVFLDAPPPMFDLTCIGNTAPATATANITLSGTAQVADVSGLLQFSVTPIEGGTVKACDTVACNGPADGSATTAMTTGDWSIGPIATGSAPLADYVQLTASGIRTSYIYPGMPFTADQADIPALAFGPGIIDLLSNISACSTADTTPLLTLAITDCANEPVTDTANLDIEIKQNGAVVAKTGDPNVIDLSTIPMAPPEVAGLFLVCGLAENNATTVGAMYNGMNFLAHDVKTVNATTSGTIIRPGY